MLFIDIIEQIENKFLVPNTVLISSPESRNDRVYLS